MLNRASVPMWGHAKQSAGRAKSAGKQMVIQAPNNHLSGAEVTGSSVREEPVASAPFFSPRERPVCRCTPATRDTNKKIPTSIETFRKSVCMPLFDAKMHVRKLENSTSIN